jgi:hypothetical protein
VLLLRVCVCVCSQELQLTPDSGMFDVLRVAIRDEEEEEVTSHFYEVGAVAGACARLAAHHAAHVL